MYGVYGLSLRSRSPENGPQVSLHAEGSPVDWLLTEGALLVLHLLLAAPAQQVAGDALSNLGIRRHFIEANGAPGLCDVIVLGSIILNFHFNGMRSRGKYV